VAGGRGKAVDKKREALAAAVVVKKHAESIGRRVHGGGLLRGGVSRSGSAGASMKGEKGHGSKGGGARGGGGKRRISLLWIGAGRIRSPPGGQDRMSATMTEKKKKKTQTKDENVYGGGGGKPVSLGEELTLTRGEY